LLKAAVKREGSQSAFAKRYGVNRTELNSILNDRRRISASVAKALGLRRVYVAERSCVTQEREASASAPSMANKVEDDLRDDDGDRGAENDTQNSHPHASRSFI
jgi:transcriptional regulator with XRE-family HTH domain